MFMRYATLALTALVLMSCNRDPNYLKQEYLKRGNDFFKAGKLKEASIYYRKSIEQDRKFDEAYYHLALTELKLGAGVGAVRPLRVAVELLKPGTPDSNDAILKLSEIEVAAAGAMGFEKAAPLIKEVEGYRDGLLKRNPNSWEGHKLAGDLAFLNVRKYFSAQQMVDAKKALGEAIREYRTSLTANPNEYATSVALARSLRLDGEAPEAETILASLTDKDKQNPAAYIDLYRQYLAERKYPEAESLLKKAIQNNPKDSSMRLELARFYLGTNKRDDLLKLLNEMKSNLSQFPDAYVQAGDFFLRVNQFDDAIKQFEEGIKKDPDKKIVYMKHEVETYVRSNRMQLATAKNEDILKLDSKDPDARGLKATLSIDKGEYGAAATELQSVVTARPQNYVAHFNLGRAYLGKGDIEQARQEFDKAVQLRPDYIMARLAQTQVALLRGDVEAAIHDADDLLRIQPNSIEGLVMKAAALQRAQKFDDARAVLEPALQKAPNAVPLMLEMGVIDLQQKKTKDAIAIFARAYQTNPNNIRGLLGESRAYLADGQLDKSVEIVRAEAQKSPDRVDLMRELGNAQAAAGQFPAAIATYQTLLAKFKDPKQQSGLLVQIAQAYRYEGDVQHSVEAFEKSRQGVAENPVTLRDLGMLYEELNRKDLAKTYYERALKLDSTDPLALNNLAYLIAENNGDLNEALSYAQRAKQRLPTFTEITDTLGWIYMKKNLTDSAIDSFKSLVVQAPQNPIYHYHYAMALNQKGDRESARKECQAALADKPNKAQEDQIRQLLSKLT
jgi:tetratricopeptide (TPR) repeat protein